MLQASHLPTVTNELPQPGQSGEEPVRDHVPTPTEGPTGASDDPDCHHSDHSQERSRTLLGVSLSTLSYFVLFLVAIDTWMTHDSLSTQRGVELNPFMDWIYHHGGVLVFLAFKLSLTVLCLIWINRRAPRTQARMAALIALSIYLPIAGIHIIGLYH